MALKLSRDLPSGLTAEYWRIHKFEIDVDKRHVRVNFRLYKDAEHRTENGESSFAEEYIEIWAGPEIVQAIKTADSNILSVLYTEAKLRNLTNAEDV